ncbi:contact-dependent growth inhibition system immunity protein [Nocardioides sediminis]|uniref:contact-dependent growth inhibition system immunity protein n=1 Tax=Nocardioides sediminis TaxID=433648 RepID=UPI000D30DA07|nr:contact-dependent growth inhibition system immunity protein [Nocardioides sediminis]
MNKADYPALSQLLGAYFHQDWHDEYGGSWEAAVDDFARREPSRVRGVTAEIATLMRTTHSAAELKKALDGLGNFYWAGDDSESYSEWLRNIKARLERETQSRPAAPVAPDTRRGA